MELLREISIQMIQALQTLSPMLDDLARFFSFMGALGFYIILIPILYWIIDKRHGKAAMLALILSGFLGLLFKQLLHQPLPYWLGEVQPLAKDATYGTPSTNASDSFAVLGYLAYRMNKEWLWAASGLSVLLIGFSHLYLGVAFPVGVLLGWLLGLGIVILIVKLETFHLPGWLTQSAARQTGIAFLLSILMIIIGLGVRLLITSTPDPLAWAGFATQARSLSDYFTFAGGFFGVACGYICIKRLLDFQTRGTFFMKAGRCLLGFAGLVLIYMSLGFVITQFTAYETIQEYSLRYIQSALMAFWILFGGPWFFLKLRLALQFEQKRIAKLLPVSAINEGKNGGEERLY